MKTRYLALLSALSCCCFDTGTVVNIAPSAHHLGRVIETAADRLNGIAGDVYEVRYTSSESRVDDQIVVRGTTFSDPETAGFCEKTGHGVIISIYDKSLDIHVAHELLHAIGLDHVKEEDNLMNPAPIKWGLNERQVKVLAALSSPP